MERLTKRTIGELSACQWLYLEMSDLNMEAYGLPQSMGLPIVINYDHPLTFARQTELIYLLTREN